MMRRYVIDWIALVLHAATVLAVIITDLAGDDFLDSTTGVSLMIMEVVTLLFHIWYVLPPGRGEFGVPRALKWVEYGISATLGTIAVLQVDRSPQWDWIVFIGFVGSAQQTIGLLIDTKQTMGLKTFFWALIAGCLIQLGEYIFVGWHTKLDVTYWVYVFFYSLFGFHAARGLVRRGRDPGDFMEEVYSLFGFAAKLTLFWSKYFDENQTVVGVLSGLAFVATLFATQFLMETAEDNSAEDNSADSAEDVKTEDRLILVKMTP